VEDRGHFFPTNIQHYSKFSVMLIEYIMTILHIEPASNSNCSVEVIVNHHLMIHQFFFKFKINKHSHVTTHFSIQSLKF